MVLNITCVIKFRGGLSRGHSALELSHDDLHGLSNDISQDVKTTSVGHTNNEVRCTMVNTGVDGTLNAGNETFTTLETESLHGVELLGKEATEVVSPVKSVVKVEQFLLGHAVILNTFEIGTNPVLNILLWDVRKLNTNFAAVGNLVSLNDIFKFPQLLLLENSRLVRHFNVKFAIKIRLGKSVSLVVKLLNERILRNEELVLHILIIFVVLGNSKRVEVSNQVTQSLIGTQKSSQLN